MVKLQSMHAIRLGFPSALLLCLAACVSPPRIIGPTHPPISPAAVVVYRPPLLPKHYTVVAKLDATGYGGWSSPQLDQMVIQKLRREAARIGANGILLILKPLVKLSGYYEQTHFGLDARWSGPPAHPFVRAEAIYIPHDARTN